MARDIGALGNVVNQFNIIPVNLVKLDWYTKDAAGVWQPTPLFLTNAGQNIIYAGDTYQGIGSLGAISGGEEGFDLQSYSLTLTLGGIPTEFMQQIFSDVSFANAYTNRPAYVYTAFLDSNYQVLDTPILVFSGQMDAATVEISDTVTVQLTVESRLVDWEKPRGGRFNAETQKARFPLDTGFQFVEEIVAHRISFPGGIYLDGLIDPEDGR